MTLEEEHHRFVVLQGEAGAAAWNRLCVRQADCVLAVAPSTRQDVEVSCQVSVEESDLLWGEGSAKVNRTELVLLHNQTSAHPLPRGTQWWLDARPDIDHWHHVRLPLRQDYERLVIITIYGHNYYI